jgi:hypothetical protein
MNQHDIGRLRSYLDGELVPTELAQMTSHLDGCAQCRETLSLLRGRAQAVSTGLEGLEFQGRVPEPVRALARFRAVSADSDVQPLRWEDYARRISMTWRNVFSPRWRPLTVSISAVLVLVILFSIAPVREVAADFLGLFRVRKFAVIPLDQQQMDRLENLARQAEGAFGEPQIVREEGPEQVVTDAAQATALAGYGVRTPGRLPEGVALEKFAVQAGPAMHFEFDRGTITTILQAVGASTDGLPQTEKIVFEVDVASIVLQQYRAFGNRLEFIQAPSPQVDLPQGIDPTALAETGFLFLGMPAEDAARLAKSIDWTSTLVIPLPTNAGKAREVSVDGVTGLLLESVDAGRQNNALLWERDGILYFLSGNNVDEKTLLDAADSLQ